MGRRANYKIERRTPVAIVIRDIGPWSLWMTVTNAAEETVAELLADGELPPGRRLFYLDSEGEPGELKVSEGRFAGFAPWDGSMPA